MNHVTPEMGNTHDLVSKGGMTSILTANGEPMTITRSGKSTFVVGSNTYELNDLLIVPTSSKKLLSVKRFWEDNPVKFLFDANSVKVMDRASNATLNEGDTENSLYRLPIEVKKGFSCGKEIF